jgi:hypothetical protein
MAYDLLNRLKSEGSLGACSLLISDPGSLRKTRNVFGRDIRRITLSRIEFLGGETGHETLSVPMDSILEIECGGRILFRKKKRIERIYPRA